MRDNEEYMQQGTSWRIQDYTNKLQKLNFYFNGLSELKLENTKLKYCGGFIFQKK